MHADLPGNGATINLPFGIAWLSDAWHIKKRYALLGKAATAESTVDSDARPYSDDY